MLPSTENDARVSASSAPVFDMRYLKFFDFFNHQQYFEAHDVLEELWLVTTGAKRDFYKGLIQTAVALLKLQQGKPQPAVRLADRAASHLENYLPTCDGVDVRTVLILLEAVREGKNPSAAGAPPRLELKTQCD